MIDDALIDCIAYWKLLLTAIIMTFPIHVFLTLLLV
jgi:hypothetical protein